MSAQGGSQVPSAVEVSVTDEQSAVSIDGDDVVSLVRFVLADARSGGRVGVLFVDDPTIAELNQRFLGISGPTDVITFPLEEATGTASPGDPGRAIDGEIVVSTETAVRQAPLYDLETLEETLVYVVHGLLHLLGEDDLQEAAAGRMASRQRQLLQRWMARKDR